MRCFGFFLLLPLLGLVSAAQTPAGDGQNPANTTVATGWQRILPLYEAAHGGADRLDNLSFLSCDFTPSIFDKDGVETKLSVKKIEMRYHHIPPQDLGDMGVSKHLPRAVRIESEIDISETETPEMVQMVSIVTPIAVKVWTENTEGGFDEVDSKQYLNFASLDASALLAHFDLILMPRSMDLRFKYSGVKTRDGVKYAAVDAEFAPSRSVPLLYRNYHSPETTLIERLDVFDPATKQRIGCTRISDYEDHDGLKFPRSFTSVDRDEKPVGSWSFTNVKINPELSPERFLKP
ncbi:MAG: hypothetical protein P8N31_09880 [Planctomycetota bacterium]|jgi:hypothetical protein|nr:hypothetical protein [Planctomycetota bacterium]MDG2143853.1 hypothetical protein [Planctomycetota bacterium]